MDLGIRGKKALVCASSKGLGKACAMALAQEGTTLVINGRNEAELEKTADEIRKLTGSQIRAVAADISTQAGQEVLLSACPDPDILINNNGGPPFRNFRSVDREALIDGLIMNMITPIEFIQRVIDSMIDRGFGRIVNITSISVKMPVSGLDLSSGARAGLTAFLAGAAREIADKNVTVNNLLPGYFYTDRLRSGFEATAEKERCSREDVELQWKKNVPAGRFGKPEEFGRICAFLCSEHAGYITGQNILIDGGLFSSAF